MARHRPLHVLALVMLAVFCAARSAAAGNGPAPGAAPPTAAPVPEPSVRLVSQPRYERALDATFSTGVAPDGSVWTGLRAAELTVDKWVTAAGETTMTIGLRRDLVRFNVTQQGIAVTRGRRSVSLTPDNYDEERVTAVRTLLLGSRAVRAFRAFSSALEERETDDTIDLLSTLTDGALVAFLDGDHGALDRAGKRATRALRNRMRQARMGAAQFTDCVTAYQLAILDAYRILGQCYSASSWTEYLLNYPWCSLGYFLRAEQYIFQFVSCLAIP